MSAQTRGFPSGEMRASDADRDLAIAELSEHFQTGRLTQDEFDERSAKALQARTGRELSDLFTDLPGPSGWPDGGAPRAGADSPGLGRPAVPWGSPDQSALSGPPWQGPAWTGPASRPSRGPLGRSPSRRPAPFVFAAVVAAIVAASLLGSAVHVGVGSAAGAAGFGWLIPVLIVVLVVRRITRRR
jgi:Domain of unknown function (DUF1707)